MAKEEVILTRSIRKALTEARAAEATFAQLYASRVFAEAAGKQLEETSEEYDDAERTLDHWIDKAFRELLILTERLGIDHLRKQLSLRYHRNRSKFATLEMTGSEQEFCTPFLYEIESHFDSLAPMVAGDGVDGLQVFENILGNTAKIIRCLGITPEKETTVNDAILNVVRWAFLDAQKEISIAKGFKAYKPDIGVPSLMAAAEYKFIDKESKFSICVDGILTDMLGYSGSDDWRTFYAVFYAKEAWRTQADLEHAFGRVGAPGNWKPILVVGP